MTVAKHAEHAECQNMLLDPRTKGDSFLARNVTEHDEGI